MHKADNLPLSSAVVTKSGKLNFLEPSGPLQACNGTALPFSPKSLSGAYPEWVPGVLVPGIKQLGHGADRTPPPNVGATNKWSCTSTSTYAFMVCKGTALLY